MKAKIVAFLGFFLFAGSLSYANNFQPQNFLCKKGDDYFIKIQNSLSDYSNKYVGLRDINNAGLEGLRRTIETQRSTQTRTIFQLSNLSNSGLKIPTSIDGPSALSFSDRLSVQNYILNDYRQNLPVYKGLQRAINSSRRIGLPWQSESLTECPFSPVADTTDPDDNPQPTTHPCNWGVRWVETCDNSKPPVCHNEPVTDSQCD